MLQIRKEAFIPDVVSHLELAERLFDDAEQAWRRAVGSSPAEAHQWRVLTVRKIESAGRTLEFARSLIEALSVSPQDSN